LAAGPANRIPKGIQVKLFEFEAKAILREYGIPVPKGRVAGTAAEAARIAAEIGGAVAVKSQVLASARGKAGGILFADDASAAQEIASRLLGKVIRGSIVNRVLVEQKLRIERELFASVAIDAKAKSYVAMASATGGIDIESVAESQSGKIARRWFRPAAGLDMRSSAEMAAGIAVSQAEGVGLARIIDTLGRIALEKDAELVEINPLIATTSGDIVAADARITIDDNSLFRHPEFQNRSAERVDDSPLEAEARHQGLAYVDLSGTVGIIGNGAGLVMATLDLVDLFGGKPANFLDIGGGARPEIVKKSLLLVMSKPEVRSVLVNILGGITRCDLVAEGVIAGLKEAPVKKPVAVRMIGTNEEEGTRMLADAGVRAFESMEEAVKEVLLS
jgi:succinyl-CoA synthetase beta subunit